MPPKSRTAGLRLLSLAATLFAFLTACATDSIDDYKIREIQGFYDKDRVLANPELNPFRLGNTAVYLSLNHSGYDYFDLAVVCLSETADTEVEILAVSLDSLPQVCLEKPVTIRFTKNLLDSKLCLGRAVVPPKIATAELRRLTEDARRPLGGSVKARLLQDGQWLERTIPVSFIRHTRTYITMR